MTLFPGCANYLVVFGRTLAGPLFFGTIARLPPLVLAFARPGPGRLRYFVDFEAFVFFEINGISILTALKPSCSLSGSTCLVAFAPSFGTIFSNAVKSVFPSEVSSDLAVLVLLLLVLLL